MISRTMVIIEERLTLTENRVSAVIAHTRGLAPVPVESSGAVDASAEIEEVRASAAASATSMAGDEQDHESHDD